jgi:AraC-like DNA-binding protein/mannose-6-phosphate isomerase-like protein (cupin superfamily)
VGRRRRVETTGAQKGAQVDPYLYYSSTVIRMGFDHLIHDGVGIGAGLVNCALTVAAHRHDYYEIGFVMSGSGQHADCEVTMPVIAGDVWIIRPGDWHALPAVSPDLEVFDLLLTPAFLDRHCPKLDVAGLAVDAAQEDTGDTSPKPAVYLTVTAATLDRLRGLLWGLCEALRATHSKAQELLCAGLTLQILGLLDQQGARGERRSDGAFNVRNDLGVLRAAQFIEDHYDARVTLADLAVQAGYVPAYLSRKFRQRLGVAPSEYLLSIRLHRACMLLRNTDLSVTAIAHGVGFTDTRYFARCFHRAVGMTPRAFRASVVRFCAPSGAESS